jgi:hypothetical protein
MANSSASQRIDLIGPAGAGKSALLRVMESSGALNGAVEIVEAETPSAAPAAVICTTPAALDPKILKSDLAPLAEQLNQLAAKRGRVCAVGALPVFLVLTKCDLLARPKDTLGDWLERIEACKHLGEKTLAALLTPADQRGFGSPRVHCWATATQRPVLAGGPPGTQEPFGVRELVQQALAAARDHDVRRERQSGRLLGLVWLTISGLVFLAFLTGAFIWVSPLRLETAKPESTPWPAGDLLVQGQALLADAQKLLRFEEYRPGTPAATEWPRWRLDARNLVADLRAVRADLAREQIGQHLTGDLLAVEQALVTLQERAALFGLAGDLPDQPAVLHFPAEAVAYEGLRKQVQERLERLRKSYPQFAAGPLPPQIPLGVAEELHSAAQVSYEKLLTPVRTEIQARVQKLGEGRESPRAWQELADGWLALQAENDLYEWRELAVLLARLAGRPQPSDPLTQLNGFLRQQSFALPLERVALRLPANFKVQGDTFKDLKPVEAPLVITLRTETGLVTTLNLLPLAGGGSVPGEPDVYSFGVGRQNPLVHGRLLFKPGDDVSARLKLAAPDGTKWVLNWPLADSRSQVFSFAVLTQAPRLHRDDETTPTKRPIAFGVRLVFSEPSAFELPDLMPE